MWSDQIPPSLQIECPFSTYAPIGNPNQGCVAVHHLSQSWQVKTRNVHHAAWFDSDDSKCHFSSSTPPTLIHPVKALCILNGDVQFLPQLLKRLIGREIQPVEAEEKETIKVEITSKQEP